MDNQKYMASPDGLLTVAGITINVLPVLMTAINVVSSAIYLKGFPRFGYLEKYPSGVLVLFGVMFLLVLG